MTPEKRKKIKALMESPASTENEKEICRKLLKDNPEEDPRQERWDRMREALNSGRVTFEPPAPRSRESGDFWSAARQSGKSQGAKWYEDALNNARQQAAAQGQDRQAAARQQAANQQAGGLFGQAVGGAFGTGLNGLFGNLGQQTSIINELAKIIAEDLKKRKPKK